MNDDIVLQADEFVFDSAKLCECYSALDTTLGNESTFSWSDGTVALGSNGAGGWTLDDGQGNTWSNAEWDGTGCAIFTLSSGSGEATVSVCCVECPAALSARPAFYEWNMAAQKWVKLMDRDPEPPAGLPPGTFDGQIKEV